MYKVFINNRTYQWQRCTLAEAAQQCAAAHRAGDRWDVRKLVGQGGEYRPLVDSEAAELIAHITAQV